MSLVQRVVERVRPRVCESVLVRLDAGSPDGATLTSMESAGIDYVARIRNNAVLDRMAAPYLRRPPGRLPRGRGHRSHASRSAGGRRSTSAR